MSGHTPGPWRTGWLQSFDALSGEAVAFVYRRDPDDERETADNRICIRGGDDPVADARLIAAAPDLLEALKQCEHTPWCDSWSGGCVCDCPVPAAIAKAEGRK